MLNGGMDFEITVRLFLGDKAYHIAGQENHDRYRREWLLKAAKKILRRIDVLETTTEGMGSSLRLTQVVN